MSNLPNLYGSNALYYDYYSSDKSFKEDIPFYLELANSCKKPILEICCGTGRVALELARANYEVHGIDLSPNMLNIFEQKIMKEPENIQNKIKFFLKNMISFELSYKYGLVIIACNSFMFLINDEDVIKCFHCIKKHLKYLGRIVIALHNYFYIDELELNIKEIKNESLLPNGECIKFIQWVEDIDISKQIITCAFRHDIFKGDKLLYSTPIDKNISRYYKIEQIKLLINKAGIKINNIYGSFNYEQFHNESDHMIFDCYL